MAGSLALGPVRQQPAVLAVAPTALPLTGSPTDILRIKHPVEVEAIAAPTEIYAQYVPPPDPPLPVAAAPVPAQVYAARPLTSPAGYVTINVPVYRQAMTLDCETSALRMGLAAFGHYYADSALFAYENPDTRAAVMGPNHTVVQWGDPYANFVGNVWGNDYTPTGYGVYYPVIVAIAHSHGMPNAYGGEGFAPGTIQAGNITADASSDFK